MDDKVKEVLAMMLAKVLEDKNFGGEPDAEVHVHVHKMGRDDTEPEFREIGTTPASPDESKMMDQTEALWEEAQPMMKRINELHETQQKILVGLWDTIAKRHGFATVREANEQGHKFSMSTKDHTVTHHVVKDLPSSN